MTTVKYNTYCYVFLFNLVYFQVVLFTNFDFTAQLFFSSLIQCPYYCGTVTNVIIILLYSLSGFYALK